MPAATPPRPPKAIQDIIDGVAEHGVDYEVEALPQPDDFTVACGITLFGGPQAKALEVILVRLCVLVASDAEVRRLTPLL
jgi:hypothetical protein